MKLLKNRTYYRLTGEIDTAKEDVRVLKLKFEEMQQRKDYLKEEFVRISDLLDKSKDQQIALNIGLEKTLNENDVLKKQLADALDLIKKLTEIIKGEK